VRVGIPLLRSVILYNRTRSWAVVKGPFVFLAILLLGTLVCPIALPLAILLGYPALVFIGLWYAGRALAGRLERPAEVIAVWVAYLGLILTLNGIILCTDTALAGTSPSLEQKRFGIWFAYLGGAVAVTAVVAAYTLDWRRRAAHKQAVKPTLLDDWAA
jgi:hypothetical protein